MKRKLLTAAGVLAAASFLATGSTLAETITFDDLSLVDGDLIPSFTVLGGITGSISATNLSGTEAREVRVYDTDIPVGRDPDLEAPFQNADPAGTPATLTADDVGFVAIIQEVGSPAPDDEAAGGIMILSFDAPLYFKGLDLFDASQGSVLFEVFSGANATGTLLGSGTNPFGSDDHLSNPTGVNKFESIDLMSFTGGLVAAQSLRITLDGVSGAIDNIHVVPIPAAAWLFASAIVGAGMLGRRKKKV